MFEELKLEVNMFVKIVQKMDCPQTPRLLQARTLE